MRPSQQVQVSEIECLKPFYLPLCPCGTPTFDAIPSARMRKGMCRQCAAFALGGQPSADVLFCVALTQAIQPDRPLAARRQHGHIFTVGGVPHHIPLPPQEHQKRLVCIRLSDESVNIVANDAADGWLAGVLRFPFGVVLSLALRRDYRQVVFPAQDVGCASHFKIIAAGTAVIFLTVHKRHRVHHHMIVQMRFIQVRTNDRLIPLAKQPLGKFHADTVCLLRRYLPGRKGLDEMIPHHAAQLAKPLLRGLHLRKGCLTTFAVDGGRKEQLFRFLWICGISNTRIQRSLFSVDSIVYPLIQSVTDGDDLRDGHIRVLSPPARASPASP